MSAGIERLTDLGCQHEGSALAYAERLHTLLQKSALLQDRTLDEMRRLAGYMDVYSTPEPMQIIVEGAPGDYMILVISGTVEVMKKDRWGSSKRIAIVSAGETLGEMSMMDGEPRFASCFTREPSIFAALSRDRFISMIHEEPGLGASILLKLNQMLSQRLRQTSSKLVSYMETQRSS
jgi:CRP/FNR family cyclic AMP-dependent transcriptional regulator